jgi:hypothetical protein
MCADAIEFCTYYIRGGGDGTQSNNTTTLGRREGTLRRELVFSEQALLMTMMRQKATKENRRQSISGDGICTLGIDDSHAHVQAKTLPP